MKLQKEIKHHKCIFLEFAHFLNFLLNLSFIMYIKSDLEQNLFKFLMLLPTDWKYGIPISSMLNACTLALFLHNEAFYHWSS